MKLSKLFFGVAAAAMFAACSSDEIVQEQAQPQWDADGNGYMAFSVSMPQTPASRATTNDQFEDGLPAEFEVKNMVLVLFKGTDEASATFASAYNVTDTDFGMVGASTDNVTSDRLIVQKIVNPNAAASENIYAFVVLNHNGLFTVNSDNSMDVSGITGHFTGTIADLQGNKITGIDNSASNKFQSSTNGFIMMNAPLFTAAGGTGAPSGSLRVLSPVEKSYIKGSKTEAQANVAAHVYVERAVAKVTLKVPATEKTHTVTAPNQANFTWTVASWQLDNTNKKSYLVRNTTDFTTWTGLHSAGVTTKPYRFVGGESVAHNPGSLPNGAPDATAALYRTYFAKDPNFATADMETDHKNDYNITTTASELKDKFGNDYPQYCAENTFDVENQVWNHTTRVIVKATLKGETLYGRPGDDGFFSASAIKTLAYNKVLDDFNAEYALLSQTEKDKISGTVDFGSSTITISSTADEVSVLLGGLTCTGATTDPSFILVNKYQATVNKKTSSDFALHYYTGGEAYYQARIKHFGNDLTPWNDWEDGTTNTKPSASVIYPNNTGSGNTQNDKYLGRWGMLRNNWYDLNVNNINKLGEFDPANLTLNGTTDDELESWISVDVNILSWAKRTQDIDF